MKTGVEGQQRDQAFIEIAAAEGLWILASPQLETWDNIWQCEASRTWETPVS